jgi:hypothetical protein
LFWWFPLSPADGSFSSSTSLKLVVALFPYVSLLSIESGIFEGRIFYSCGVEWGGVGGRVIQGFFLALSVAVGDEVVRLI